MFHNSFGESAVGRDRRARRIKPKQRVLDGKNGLYDNVTGNFYAYYGDKADFTAFIPPPGSVILID